MMNQKSVSDNIEKYFDEMFKELEDCNEEPWDEETQKNWEEKMNQPVAFRKITEEELQKLKEQKQNKKQTV